jgi:DNA-binding transcriptional MerR regulator
MSATPVTIPNRPVFRAQEVCELAGVQAYVLRTWEAEFPELGAAKTAGGPRVYRRADVERVLRIKHLLFVEGLTLAGARRRLSEEGFGPTGEDAAVADADVAALIDGETRQQLREVRRGLHWILGVLSGEGAAAGEFVLQPEASARGQAALDNRASGRPPKASPRLPARTPARTPAAGRKK